MRWPWARYKEKIAALNSKVVVLEVSIGIERDRGDSYKTQRDLAVSIGDDRLEKLNSALTEGAELTIQLEDANSKYSAERQRRIQAEAIAAERLQSIDRAYQQVDRADRARDEAIHHKFQSLDLVNASLLKSVEPERDRHPQTTRDPKVDSIQLAPRSSALAKRRKIERSLVRTLQTMAKAPYPVREVPKEGAIITPEMPIEEVS